MKFEYAIKHAIQCIGQGISLKSEKKKHDIKFQCIHNQMCMPQYKANVQSTWDV